MTLIILIPAVLFLGILFWLKKKPELPQNKAGAINL
jgi:hypothetical protein